MSLKIGDKIIHLVRHQYAGRDGGIAQRTKIKCYVGQIDHFKTKVIMIDLLKDGKYYRKAVYPDSIEIYTETAIERLRSQYGSLFMLLR